MKFSLPPPQEWSDFQDLVEAVTKIRFPNKSVFAYGRRGQEQDGIDIYVEEDNLGIQAKNKRLFNSTGELLPNGGLTESYLTEVVKEAERFSPTLSRLVIATTALTDRVIQDHVFALNRERRARNCFGVEIWFWEPIQADINNHQELLHIYYSKILSLRPAFDPECLLLVTIRDSFTRPAITTPVRCENSADDFLQALADTQETLATGVSKERETRQIRSRSLFGFSHLDDGPLKTLLGQAWADLQTAREKFTAALGKKGPDNFPVIEQHNKFIVIRDRSLELELDRLRSRALKAVNRALAMKKLGLVDTRLSF